MKTNEAIEPKSFEAVLLEHIASCNAIQQKLVTFGVSAVTDACKKHGVRGLSKLTGLSPTYLSQVKSGKAIISIRAMLKVLEAMKDA